MDKRIYPSTKLGVFITKHFSTYEETTQNKALFVAWLAIFVSIALTFAPYFQPKDNSDIESITENLKDIKSSIEKKDLSEELSSKMDITKLTLPLNNKIVTFFRFLTRSKTVVTHFPNCPDLPCSAPQAPLIPVYPPCCRATQTKFCS